MTDKRTVSEAPEAGKSPAAMHYNSTAEQAKLRILALIPEHPEIMDIDGPFELFKIEGFSVSDLGLTLFQAGWALNAARNTYKQNPSAPRLAAEELRQMAAPNA